LGVHELEGRVTAFAEHALSTRVQAMSTSTISPNGVVLLADIGGTNARFALRSGHDTGPVKQLAVADHPRFDDALTAFLDREADGSKVEAAVIAVAGPVRMGRAEFTNSPWTIDAAALKTALGFKAVSVVNDFEAVARAQPSLKPTDLFRLGGQEPLVTEPILVLGPGTGLGVACLVPAPGGQPLVITTEAGHMHASSWSPRTDAIIEFLRGRHARVSWERMISGRGLENLLVAVAAVDGLDVPQRTAAEITQTALDGTCPASQATVDLFFALLGECAGNLALAFGARGGVYIAGGIVPRFVKDLEASAFRQRFDDKGRLSPYLKAIPCWLITHPNTAFLGLETMAQALTSPGRQS
jgi:glucokinase